MAETGSWLAVVSMLGPTILGVVFLVAVVVFLIGFARDLRELIDALPRAGKAGDIPAATIQQVFANQVAINKLIDVVYRHEQQLRASAASDKLQPEKSGEP